MGKMAFILFNVTGVYSVLHLMEKLIRHGETTHNKYSKATMIIIVLILSTLVQSLLGTFGRFADRSEYMFRCARRNVVFLMLVSQSSNM